jgi:predicted transcriptional regulator
MEGNTLNSFTGKELKQFRKELNLSTRNFAYAFGISQATVVRVENNKASGSEALKRIEIFSVCPHAAIWYVRKHGQMLHSKISRELLKRLKDRIVEGEFILPSPYIIYNIGF